MHTLAKRMLAEAATANGDASLEQSIYGAGFAVTAALFEAALAGEFDVIKDRAFEQDVLALYDHKQVLCAII